MIVPTTQLDSLVTELERAAARLREGNLERAEAAGLVQRCADLAARLSGELDDLARASARADSGEARPGQEELL